MAAFSVAFPLAVISTFVLGLAHDAGFFHDGQVKFQVTATTRLTQAVHDRINVGIIRFFDGSESLPDALRASGAPPDVYSQKEILHMNDVRDVIRFFALLQRAAVVVSLLLVVGLVVRWNRGGRRLASRAFIVSAAATLVIGVVVGALTYFAFDSLFLFFHQMTFHNEFWELDPRTDRLIQMFPFGFWYDAMVATATRVLAIMMLVGAIGIVTGRLESSPTPVTEIPVS